MATQYGLPTQLEMYIHNAAALGLKSLVTMTWDEDLQAWYVVEDDGITYFMADSAVGDYTLTILLPDETQHELCVVHWSGIAFVLGGIADSPYGTIAQVGFVGTFSGGNRWTFSSPSTRVPITEIDPGTTSSTYRLLTLGTDGSLISITSQGNLEYTVRGYVLNPSTGSLTLRFTNEGSLGSNITSACTASGLGSSVYLFGMRDSLAGSIVQCDSAGTAIGATTYITADTSSKNIVGVAIQGSKIFSLADHNNGTDGSFLLSRFTWPDTPSGGETPTFDYQTTLPVVYWVGTYPGTIKSLANIGGNVWTCVANQSDHCPYLFSQLIKVNYTSGKTDSCSTVIGNTASDQLTEGIGLSSAIQIEDKKSYLLCGAITQIVDVASASTYFTFHAIPPAMTVGIPAKSGDDVTVTWDAFTGAASYKASVDNGAFSTDGISGTTLTHTGGAAATHTYIVRAYDSVGAIIGQGGTSRTVDRGNVADLLALVLF